MDRRLSNDTLRDWAADLAIAAACAVFLGLLGPFGSYLNGPAWQRVAFQLACFLPGLLYYGLLIRLVVRLELKPMAKWTTIVVATAIVTAPFQLWVWFMATAFWPFLAQVVRPLDWYLQGVLTAEPMVVGFTLLVEARKRRRQQAREAAGAPPSIHGLLGAPPASVLCLQMEDHYVRVHTATGSRLVLAPLGQAIAALEAADGLRVHRSWWVARKAVARAVADGRNLRLELSNGVTAPVARTSVAAVRAAGWIAGPQAS